MKKQRAKRVSKTCTFAPTVPPFPSSFPKNWNVTGTESQEIAEFRFQGKIQPKNLDLANYAYESGVYPGFQRDCYRLLPFHRKLLVGFCRQFDPQAAEVVPRRPS
jgi:hypothetical protein